MKQTSKTFDTMGKEFVKEIFWVDYTLRARVITKLRLITQWIKNKCDFILYKLR